MDEELETYQKARSILDQEGLIFISDKQIIRYLKACGWNLDDAIQAI